MKILCIFFILFIIIEEIHGQVGSDPFYHPSTPIADLKPGTILKSRKVRTNLVGYKIGSDSWQLLYRTTNAEGKPDATVATIIVPRSASKGKKHPLVSYQFPEDGLGSKCAPSYKLVQGIYYEAPLIFPLLAKGWIVVVPDFEGPNSEYLVGALEGQATLDAIRAAMNFNESTPIDETRIGLAGYSGGAHATLWAAEIQPKYAPEIKLAAVVAGGVPPNITNIANKIDGGPMSGVELAGAMGIARGYPELKMDEVLNKRGHSMKNEIKNMCIEEYTTLFAFRRLSYFTKMKAPLSVPNVHLNLNKVALGHSPPKAPLFIYQSHLDEIIPFKDVERLVEYYCSSGVKVKFYGSWLGDHVTLAITTAFKSYQFIADRFAGKEFKSSCYEVGILDEILNFVF